MKNCGNIKKVQLFSRITAKSVIRKEILLLEWNA